MSTLPAGHVLLDGAESDPVTQGTLAELRDRFPGRELVMTPPSMTAGGWWRAWARRLLPDGRWDRVNAPWVSHDPERAARALLGERPAEYDR